jgi:hypothetical protein
MLVRDGGGGTPHAGTREPFDFGYVSDVLDEWAARFAAKDYERLFLIGWGKLNDDEATLPAELKDDRRRAPVVTAVQMGAAVTVADVLGINGEGGA